MNTFDMLYESIINEQYLLIEKSTLTGLGLNTKQINFLHNISKNYKNTIKADAEWTQIKNKSQLQKLTGYKTDFGYVNFIIGKTDSDSVVFIIKDDKGNYQPYLVDSEGNKTRIDTYGSIKKVTNYISKNKLAKTYWVSNDYAILGNKYFRDTYENSEAAKHYKGMEFMIYDKVQNAIDEKIDELKNEMEQAIKYNDFANISNITKKMDYFKKPGAKSIFSAKEFMLFILKNDDNIRRYSISTSSVAEMFYSYYNGDLSKEASKAEVRQMVNKTINTFIDKYITNIQDWYLEY